MCQYVARRLCLALALCAATIAYAEPAPGPDPVRLAVKQPVPDGYRTYTMFLICAPGWLRPQFEDRMKDLYEQFNAFGRAIGSEHAAVWFWDKQPTTGSYVEAIDVERSVAYCSRHRLAPSGGPYLLLTDGHPDKEGAKATMVLGLAAKTPAEIAQILESLTDDLVLHGTATKTSDREDFWRDFQRSFERLQAAVGSMAAGVTLGITTPFFKVDVKR
jgi:hypothetical protein